MPELKEIELREKRRRKKCKLKAEFKSKRRIAWRAKELRKKTGMNFQYYRCDICGKFHLTTH